MDQTLRDKALQRRNLLLVLAAASLVGFNHGIFESIFNNYLSEVHHLASSARGVLEFPRELPGFLVAVLAGLLFVLSDSRAAAVATGALALGLIGLGYFSSSFWAMVAWMMLWSAGHHVYVPLEQSLGVALSDRGRTGRRLGQLGAAQTSSAIIGAAVVWIGVDYAGASFGQFFALCAVAAAFAGLILWNVHLKREQPGEKASFRSRFFFRREYGVFYAMCVLFGARKQVFLTFGPWVLVDVFGEPASIIAKLWVVSSVLGIAFRPALGWMIDKLGERPILVADALALALVCIGYGFGPSLPWGPWGLRIGYACFVLDQMLFAVGMARTSYLKRIAVREDDLTPTLSLGVSIDHAVSMTLPIAAGFIWTAYGYPVVFALAALIALVNAFVCNLARVPGPSKGVAVAS